MKRIYKVLAICVGILVLIFLLITGYVYTLFSREVPPDNATIRIGGLEKPVEAIIDGRGVPHIFGHSDEDLVRVLGYFHARDRLWQLDLVRRASAGKMSEAFGNALFDYDVFQRTIGFRREAVKKFREALDEDSLRLMQAYCDGINAYINSAPRYPTIEFRILGYEMEPWTPEDVVTLARSTSWTLSSNWTVEILRAAISAERGDEAMWNIMPRHSDPGPFIIPPDQRSYKKEPDNLNPPEEHGRIQRPENVDRRVARGRPDTPVGQWQPEHVDGLMALLDRDRKVRETPGGAATVPLASNNWVLSPKKTESGGAILCNDPHLELLLPSVWHESHIVGDDIDVFGVVFPGTPFIVLGHTPRVAWGATVSVADTQDLYKIVTDPAHPNRYLYDGEWRPFEIAKEVIRVRTKGGHEERTVEVRLTVHGPVITDIVDLGENLPPMALRWTGYEPSNELRALFGMARATDWKSFLDALKDLKVPPQNWVYADSNGHIGYIAGGIIPIRKKGDGTVPVPGDDPEYNWIGFIPYEELPQIFDPPAGYIATANNKVVPEEYPYVFSHEYAPPYRAMRIVEVLGSGEGFSADDMARLQMDTKLKLGERIAPYFVRAYDERGPEGSERLAQLVEKLRRWDYSTGTQSVAATFFIESYRQAFRLTYEDEVSPSIWNVLRENTRAYNGFDNGIEADFALFDDRRTEEKTENREDVLLSAMVEAMELLDKELGSSIEKWKWGRRHTIIFDHPFGGRHPLLRKLLSRGPYPLAGSRDTVNNTYFHWWSNPYRVFQGPSLRHIVDYGDMKSSRFTTTVGQSGHRLSRHYHDQVDDWIEGRYRATLISRSEIEAEAEGKIDFLPAGK